MEKERENARMEAKRRKLMEKRVRMHAHTCEGPRKILTSQYLWSNTTNCCFWMVSTFRG